MSNLFETRGQIVKSIIYYIGSVSLLVFIRKSLYFSQWSVPTRNFRFVNIQMLKSAGENMELLYF